MKKLYLGVIAVLAGTTIAPLAAQQHGGHDNHAEHMAAMEEHDHHAMMKKGATKALEDFRAALVGLDAEAMTALFAEESRVFENGKDEGTFANYLDHHIGPELDAIETFTFTDPTMEVDVMGHMALGRETYRYDIVLKDGRTVARDGVATSVLKHGKGGWKIIRYHSSSRPVRD